MENYMQNFTQLMKSLLSDSDTYHELQEKGIVQPVYWSEDKDGNINFDVDSIRDEFEKLMYLMEEHNDNSDFDWDNC
jgi:hypothetical protein